MAEVTTTTAPTTNSVTFDLPEKGRESTDDDDATKNVVFYNHGYCCFYFPCFGSCRRPTPASGSAFGWWERVRAGEIEERLWAKGWRAVMKAREWSEIVAGPRWKTFIRRFRKTAVAVGGGAGGRHGKFQYDPLSYALNFDDGHGQNGHLEAENVHRDFSTRFASAQPPLDFGKRATELDPLAVES